MDQELARRAVSDRPAGRLASAAHAHPARLHQHVERALRHRDAANFLDVGAGDRLMVGDDGERLDRGARELALLLAFARQQPGQDRSAVRNVQRPRDPDEIDAASGVEAAAAPPSPPRRPRPRTAGRRSSLPRAARRRRTPSPRRCARPRAIRRARDRVKQLRDIIRGGRAAHELSLELERQAGCRRGTRFDAAGSTERSVRALKRLLPAASGSRGRSQIGANVLSWRISTLPSRTSSSEAENEEARALRRIRDRAQASKQQIVESGPVGPAADEPRQGLARLGERPDLARLEANAGARVLLRLPRVGREQIIEVRLVGHAARRLDRLRLASGEEVAPQARAIEQQLAGLADRLELAQPPRERLGERGGVRLGRLRRGGKKQARLQKGEPGGHDQIVGGEFEPQLARGLDEREILLGERQDRRCARDRPSAAGRAPATGRADPRNRRDRR